MAINSTKDFDEMSDLSNKLKQVKQNKRDTDNAKDRLKQYIAELKAMPGYETKILKVDRDEVDSISAEIGE